MKAPKYFENSLTSGYIKSILTYTPLPIYETINELHYMIKGARYIYNSNVIECTESGNTNSFNGAYKQGSYKIVSSFDTTPNDSFGRTYRNFSTEAVYDSATHRGLGEYLRFYRDTTDVDLMPFYNCFEEFEIASNLPGYRTYLTHIHFNVPYTVAIDTVYPILIQPVLYNSGNITELDSRKQYFSAYSNPTIYRYNTDDLNLYSKQKDFFMLLYVPKSCDSSIAIIEGEWNTVRASNHIINNDGDNQLVLSWVNKVLGQPPVLLQLNIERNIPYSPVLIEYLLHNSIDSTDWISDDVTRLQKKIYKNTTTGIDWGVWTLDFSILIAQLKQSLYMLYTPLSVESDFESLVNQGNIVYTPGVLFYPGRYEINKLRYTLYINYMNEQNHQYDVAVSNSPQLFWVSNVFDVPYTGHASLQKPGVQESDFIMHQGQNSLPIEMCPVTDTNIIEIYSGNTLLVKDTDYVLSSDDNVIYFTDAAWGNNNLLLGGFSAGEVISVKYVTHILNKITTCDIRITQYR